jgi:hypothetical protein
MTIQPKWTKATVFLRSPCVSELFFLHFCLNLHNTKSFATSVISLLLYVTSNYMMNKELHTVKDVHRRGRGLIFRFTAAFFLRSESKLLKISVGTFSEHVPKILGSLLLELSCALRKYKFFYIGNTALHILFLWVVIFWYKRKEGYIPHILNIIIVRHVSDHIVP